MPIGNGRGIRDNIVLLAAGIVAQPLVFNDEACRLEFVTARADVAGGAKGTGTLTSDNTNVSNNDTVTIGTRVYTFKTALTSANGDIFIGADADTSLGNLVAAINAAAGSGTKYSAATVINADVTAAAVGSHATVVTSKLNGSAVNVIATLESAAHLSWGAAVLASGADYKVTLGYVEGTQAPASATTVIASGGEINLISANSNLSAHLISRRVVLPKHSWLVIKSVSGSAGSLTRIAVSILRRRMGGPY